MFIATSNLSVCDSHEVCKTAVAVINNFFETLLHLFLESKLGLNLGLSGKGQWQRQDVDWISLVRGKTVHCNDITWVK